MELPGWVDGESIDSSELIRVVSLRTGPFGLSINYRAIYIQNKLDDSADILMIKSLDGFDHRFVVKEWLQDVKG